MAKELPEDIRNRVNRWFEEKIKTGAIARDTEAFNQATIAKDDLLEILAELWPSPAPANASGTPAAKAE